MTEPPTIQERRRADEKFHVGTKMRAMRAARHLIGFAVPIIVTTALLWWLLRDVDPVSLENAIRAMARSPWGWAALFVSFASHFGLSTIKWRDILAGLGHRQPVARLLRLELAADLFIRVVPLRAGEAAKIWDLSANHGVPGLVTTTSIAIEIATNLCALAALAVAGQAASRLDSAVAAVASCALMLAAAVFGGRAVLRRLPRQDDVARVSGGTLRTKLDAYARRAAAIPRMLLARVGLLSILIEFSEIVVVAMLCRAMSINVPFLALVSLWPLVAFLGRLPISIGGVGVRDGALATLLPTLTVASFEQILAVGFAFTLIGVLIPCFIGLPFTVQLLSSMANASRRQASLVSAREDGAVRPRP